MALSLSPDVMIVPGEDVLHVINRRGAFDLRARNIHHVHERLAGLLDGRWGEDALVAAAPSGADAVRAYLARMREVGALVEIDPDQTDESRNGSADAPELRALGEGLRSASFEAHGLRVHVSLDGHDPRAAETHDLVVSFVAPREAGGLLLSSDRWLPRARRVTAVATVQGDGAGPDWARRAAVARWVLRNELDVMDGAPRLRVFVHDEARGTLARSAVVHASGELTSRTLPEQLRVLRPAGADQLPLASVTASHFLFDFAVTRFGADSNELRAGVLRAFAARNLVRAAAEAGGCRFRLGPIPAPVRAFGETLVDPARVAAMPVVGSLQELRAYALERLAEERFDDGAAARWSDVDLLAEAAAVPALAPVAEALRLRGTSVDARVTQAEGLYIFEANGRRGRSFFRAKAAGDLLLAVAWDALHEGAPAHVLAEPPVLACDYEAFVSRVELRRVVNHELSRGAGRKLVARKAEMWGLAGWVGDVA